ncbi:hypothetical protein ACWDNY_30025, partial [Streptomyces sp. NPDC003697]
RLPAPAGGGGAAGGAPRRGPPDGSRTDRERLRSREALYAELRSAFTDELRRCARSLPVTIRVKETHAARRAGRGA